MIHSLPGVGEEREIERERESQNKIQPTRNIMTARQTHSFPCHSSLLPIQTSISPLNPPLLPHCPTHPPIPHADLHQPPQSTSTPSPPHTASPSPMQANQCVPPNTLMLSLPPCVCLPHSQTYSLLPTLFVHLIYFSAPHTHCSGLGRYELSASCTPD